MSLLPSATEILAVLGVEDQLVGRSHECDWPVSVSGVPTLTDQRTPIGDPAVIDQAVRDALAEHTSLYTLDADRLQQLKPDLIVTQDLCDVCSIDLAAVQRAAQEISPEPVVLSLNPSTIEGVFDDVLRVGKAAGLATHASDVLVKLQSRFNRAMEYVNPYDSGQRVLYMEWTDPVFVGGHWIPQMIERAGGEHPLNPCEPRPGSGAAFGPLGSEMVAGKSVTRSSEEIMHIERNGGWDRVIVCPCGVKLDEAVEQTRQLAHSSTWFGSLSAIDAGRVAVVDGNQMFSRPGPRLVDAFEWMVGWMQDRPSLIPDDFPWAVFSK